MNTISLKFDEQMLKKLHEDFKEYELKNDSPYLERLYHYEDIRISVYSSGKVVFQGKDVNTIASAYLIKKRQSEAGSDEVGTGDYFGPVCVCACLIKEEDLEWIQQFHIQDSKQLQDAYILKIAPQLMERLIYSLLILKPSKYNEIYPRNNMVAIKAKMHNQAYIHLSTKTNKMPKACYIDQFTSQDNYYRYLANEKEVYRPLIFETKAESSHISVAAASMIARYAFLQEMENISKKNWFYFAQRGG